MKRRIICLFVLTLISSVLLLSCTDKKKDELKNKKIDKEYAAELLQERALKDSSMQNDPYSPFNRDPKAEFHKLNYYDPNPEFIFKSKFYEDEAKDTVRISGTSGEVRKVIKEGYLKINYDGNEYKIIVYKAFSRAGEPYYSIWFTDRTTGKETYGVGRYLHFEMDPDPEHIYTIDFNKAYNPYCAYSSKYTCPIPREEDYLDFAIKAGEKNFHE
ncbi:hypothetical protein BMS3Abin03_02104 [bacterium BMS3Abin03]|nr:hypothetical protein BMS3Abin03_02104 [bacterium BMS3Abin03]HDZ58925.1 DUF1684 domain-containing protein [Ignavibacteriales bacterium]